MKKFINCLLTISVISILFQTARTQDDSDDVDPRMSEAFIRGYQDNIFYQISKSENINSVIA